MNCLLEEITYLVTMATTTWTYLSKMIMDILLHHVHKGIHYHYNVCENISQCSCVREYQSVFLCERISVSVLV